MKKLNLKGQDVYQKYGKRQNSDLETKILLATKPGRNF